MPVSVMFRARFGYTCGRAWSRSSPRTSASAGTADCPRASDGRRVCDSPPSRAAAAPPSSAATRSWATPARSAGWRPADPCPDPAPAGVVETIEPGPANPAQLHHRFHRQGCLRPSLLLGSSGRQRLSSQCLQFPLLVDALQAPLQKINLQRLLADLALQLRDGPPPSAVSPGPETHCRALGETPAASDAARWGSLQTPAPPPPIERPRSSRWIAASLNSFVNCLRDKPMTQFSLSMDFES